jgi:transcriptional regulator with XRE-family HTH domain
MVWQDCRMALLKRPQRRWRLYLQEWRKFRGLKQPQVGDRMDLDFQTISRWERWAQGQTTERKPDLDDLAALAVVYGIEPEDFYHMPGEPTPNALLRGQPDEIREQAIRLIRAILRGS